MQENLEIPSTYFSSLISLSQIRFNEHESISNFKVPQGTNASFAYLNPIVVSIVVS